MHKYISNMLELSYPRYWKCLLTHINQARQHHRKEWNNQSIGTMTTIKFEFFSFSFLCKKILTGDSFRVASNANKLHEDVLWTLLNWRKVFFSWSDFENHLAQMYTFWVKLNLVLRYQICVYVLLSHLTQMHTQKINYL